MFKVVHNETVIDLLEKVIYVKYLNNSKKFVNTDKTNAQGLRSSDKRTVYILEGASSPPESSLLTVKLVKITESEYLHLRRVLTSQNNVVSDPILLEQCRIQKLEQLSSDCKKLITDGVSVLLSDGVQHSFRLTIEDQINLISLSNQIQTGATKVLYHETNKLVRWFSSEDVKRVVEAANKHRVRHTTYFNLLKHCVYNMYSREDIENLYYGVNLETLPVPEDLQLNVKEYNIV